MGNTEKIEEFFLPARLKPRPTLGNAVDMRLPQNRMLALLEASPDMKPLLFFTGKRLGQAYARGMKRGKLGFALANYKKMMERMKAAKVDVLYVGDNDAVVRQYECASCYGASNLGHICSFDAGVQTGMVNRITGRDYYSLETKCYAAGNKYCEFMIRPVEKAERMALAIKEAVK